MISHLARRLFRAPDSFDVLEFLGRSADTLATPVLNSPHSYSAGIRIIAQAIKDAQMSAVRTLEERAIALIVQILVKDEDPAGLVQLLRQDPCYWKHLLLHWDRLRGEIIDQVLADLSESLDGTFSSAPLQGLINEALLELELVDFLQVCVVIELEDASDALEQLSDEAFLDALQIQIDFSRAQIGRQAKDGADEGDF